MRIVSSSASAAGSVDPLSAARWTIVILMALVVTSIGSVASAQATKPATGTAKPVPPFAYDSVYDRYTDRDMVSLHSRIVPTSIPGLDWLFISSCRPNGPCPDLILRVRFETSAQHTRLDWYVQNAFSADGPICFELIFHQRNGQPIRDTVCADRIAKVPTETGGVVFLLMGLAVSKTYAQLLDATRVEGRIAYRPGSPIEFLIGEEHLNRLATFEAERMRRSSR